MLRKFCVILVSLALLYSLSIYDALSQGQAQFAPLEPPGVLFGEVTIDDNPVPTGTKVDLRMEWLLIIFMDSLDAQSTIGGIFAGLNSDDPGPLKDAISVSDYCSNYGPPAIELVLDATVNGLPGGNEWEVTDARGQRFFVIRKFVQIWTNPGGWIGGQCLEVYLHNGVIASYTMGDMPIDEYFLEVPVIRNPVSWGDGTYTLGEPGKVKIDADSYPIDDLKADILINGIRVDKIDDIPVGPLPYTVNAQAYEQLKINAPPYHEIQIPLETGWNMFSIPVATQSTAPADVLNSINGLFDSVWAHNASDGSWSIYTPGSPSDLTEIVHCRGYWIKMNQPDTLVIQGTDPDSTEVFLRGGSWNLAGYCSRESRSAADAVSSIEDSIDSVWRSTPSGGWRIYTPGAPSDLQTMNPGDAFWILANVDCWWNVNQ